jgi:predicted transcriptional regulator
MMTKGGKQKCVRFPDDLQTKLESMAAQGDRSFSAQVVRLVRQALAKQAFEPASAEQRSVAA